MEGRNSTALNLKSAVIKKTNFQIAEECGAVIAGGVVLFTSNKQFCEFVEKVRRDFQPPRQDTVEFQGDSTDYHGSGLPL